MRAGRLRHRIDVFAPAGSQDSYGEPSAAESPVAASVPARVEVLSGSELFEAQQIHSATTHRVTMRWRAGLTTQNWFRWDGAQLNLLSLTPDERRTEIVCLAASRD
jgi:SPP1 family predicted phage head-tail adaptor